MATATRVSVEEYLSTVYRPDCDYVDGTLLERNVGEQDHSRLQGVLYAFLFSLEKRLGIRVYLEQRIQVKLTRFRVPDICVVVGPKPPQQIFTEPPFLCIEILSPEDRMSRMLERISDYLRMGVRYVWVVDPETRQAWIHVADHSREVTDGVLRTEGPNIEVPLADIFAEL